MIHRILNIRNASMTDLWLMQGLFSHRFITLRLENLDLGPTILQLSQAENIAVLDREKKVKLVNDKLNELFPE